MPKGKPTASSGSDAAKAGKSTKTPAAKSRDKAGNKSRTTTASSTGGQRVGAASKTGAKAAKPTSPRTRSTTVARGGETGRPRASGTSPRARKAAGDHAAAATAARKSAGRGRRAPDAADESPATGTERDRQRYAEAKETAEAAIEAALEKKALVPVLIDVSGRASYTDFIAVVSGRSDRQVDAIAEGVADAMKKRGSRLIGREGTHNGRWTLLDFGDVILHVFYHPVREVFDIEGLWIDAPRIKLDVPPEAAHVQADALYAP